MDGGRFTILLILVLVLAGGSAYYSFSKVGTTQDQLATVSGQISKLQAATNQAIQAANAATKVAADAKTTVAAMQAQAQAAADAAKADADAKAAAAAKAAPAKKK